MLVVVATVCLLSVNGVDANLLLNPSFEDAGPVHWWSGAWGDGGAWYWDNNPNARSGNDLVAIGFWGNGGTGYWG